MPLYFSLIIVALSSSLALALLMPPLRQAGRGAAILHITLLCAGGAATLVAMAFALAQQLPAGAVALVVAGLAVVPCLWLARAEPAPEEPDEYTEEDDDGGQPRSPWSPSPWSRDGGRPELGFAVLTNARPAWQDTLGALPARAAAVGAPVLATPVVAAPVLAAPVLGAPVLGAPVLAAPVLTAPVLAAPVLAAPVVAAPVLAAPVVAVHTGQFQPVRFGLHPAVLAGGEQPAREYVPGLYSPVTPAPAPIVAPEFVSEPEHRLTTPPRMQRGEHPSIVHRSAPDHRVGRVRRANRWLRRLRIAVRH